jgi:hypothetical protein
MSHLEDLLCEYYEWQGYVVRRNIKVGPLSHGGHEGELDIIAYHPQNKNLVHLEPSIDGHSWDVRTERFEKKFRAGRKYVREVFPWIDEEVELEQIAVLVTSGGGSRTELAGGKLRTIDEIVAEICEKIDERGLMCSRAIPEQFKLLRTIQLVRCGYYRPPTATSASTIH